MKNSEFTPDLISIGQLIKNQAKKYNTAIAMTDSDAEYSWKELDDITDLCAAWLVSIGVKKGMHAGIWAKNTSSYVVIYLALQKIGAVAVLVNSAWEKNELISALSRTEVKYLFYSRTYKGFDNESIAKSISDKDIPGFVKAYPLPDVPFSPEHFPHTDTSVLNDIEVDVNAPSSILFTSGTTGEAKGVILSQLSILNNGKSLAICNEWTSSDSLCLCVPLFHCFGITAGIIAAITSGTSVHIVKRFGTKAVLECIQNRKCTLFSGVPTMFLALINSKNLPEYDISSLSGGLVAGSMISPVDFEKIVSTLNMTRLHIAYGQTESSPAITTTTKEDSLIRRSTTSGRPLPGVSLRIDKNSCDAASSFLSSVGRNGRIMNYQLGEIQAKGYLLMKGYFNKEEETLKAFTEDGYLKTGDQGYIDEDGYLHITGRIKDIIIRGGENISPGEIEGLILEIDGVISSKVVGVPAPIIQEEVAACIIWQPGKEKSADEVREILTANLADYKVPKYVFSMDEFPLNESGKILGYKLTERCLEIINKN